MLRRSPGNSGPELVVVAQPVGELRHRQRRRVANPRSADSRRSSRQSRSGAACIASQPLGGLATLALLARDQPEVALRLDHRDPALHNRPVLLLPMHRHLSDRRRPMPREPTASSQVSSPRDPAARAGIPSVTQRTVAAHGVDHLRTPPAAIAHGRREDIGGARAGAALRRRLHLRHRSREPVRWWGRLLVCCRFRSLQGRHLPGALRAPRCSRSARS